MTESKPVFIFVLAKGMSMILLPALTFPLASIHSDLKGGWRVNTPDTPKNIHKYSCYKKDPFNAISFLEKDKYWIGIGCICISICICICLTLQCSWLLAVQHTICFHILYLYLSLYFVFVFVFIFCICIFLTAQCSWLLAVQETICIASISEPVPYLSTPICPSRLPSYL